jgi:hypothetical protein
MLQNDIGHFDVGAVGGSRVELKKIQTVQPLTKAWVQGQLKRVCGDSSEQYTQLLDLLVSQRPVTDKVKLHFKEAKLSR